MDDASPSISELGLLIEPVVVLASRTTQSSCGGGGDSCPGGPKLMVSITVVAVLEALVALEYARVAVVCDMSSSVESLNVDLRLMTAGLWIEGAGKGPKIPSAKCLHSCV